MNSSKTKCLIESSIMIALATVLSIIKIIEMPYGGSVTLASMLPLAIIAYRHGVLWGLGSSFVFAVLQQLLGLKNLSYVTTWQSVLAVILLDYIIAFTVIGFAGVFKKVAKSQSSAMALGCLLVSVLRYICHTIAGATVWAGISIPTSAALLYSLSYNATYMVPEMIILVATAYYLGEAIDFRKPTVVRMAKDSSKSDVGGLYTLSALSLVAGLIGDVVLIAPCLQDPESGEFTFSRLGDMDFTAFAIITVISLALCIGLAVYAMQKEKSSAKENTEN